MSNYNSLKTTINANVKQNGVQAITGNILNSVLNAMVNTLGAGYQFAGVATTATNPGSPDAKVFYIANGKGTYTNFGGLEVTEDDVVVLYWDSSWHKVSTGIASQEKLSELEERIIEIDGGSVDVDLTPTDSADGYYSASSGRLTVTSSGGTRYGSVDLSPYIGKDVLVKFNTPNTSSSRTTALCKDSTPSEYDTTYRFYEKDMTSSGWIVRPSQTYHYLFISYGSGVSGLSVSSTSEDTGKIGQLETEVARNTEQISSLGNSVEDLKSRIDGEKIVDLTDRLGEKKTDGYYSESYRVMAGGCRYEPVDISEFTGDNIVVRLRTDNAGTRVLGVATSSDTPIMNLYERDGKAEGDGIYSYTFNTSAAAKLYISFKSTSSVVSVTAERKINSSEIAYISPNGDDANDGTFAHPKATIDNALKKGASTIVCFGGVYVQTIDLSNARHGRISIKALEGNKVIFKDDTKLVGDGAETLVSGKTKVYSHPLASSPYGSSSTQWLFQEGIADESTRILDTERMPLQRGYECRCDCTKIEKCSSSSVSDAIEEIEASEKYLWYYDSSAKVIYFSRPAITSATNPIYYSKGTKFIKNGTRAVSLEMFGINTMYMEFNIPSISGAMVVDCSSKYVYGNCFSWDASMVVEFVRCEAAMCFIGSNGDGFNAHADTMSSYSTADPFAKHVTCMLVDCWSHDCNDDGYSDHQRCEMTIFGGLYEYNGKAGVTPSYGSHCTCYDVYSRNNCNGFYMTASANDGGVGGQLICYNCVAENNKARVYDANNILHSGFVGNYNNSVTCVNCKSIGNKYGYFSAMSQTKLTLIDCGSLNNDIAKRNDGTMIIKNTTIVD